ncbi:DDE-type integrase/transposase/recombinase [Rhodococcus erythropolis]|uniref:DDE-type integrase/transposase/recombinase n=1 Tax=Rhodococcus erythropolis TaxID=1833 RepID=UPI000A79DAF3|nr:DDE-type integrase/transposase/recombinase [Rhodococcus erythropolis]
MNTNTFGLGTRFEVDGQLCTVISIAAALTPPIATMRNDAGEYIEIALLQAIWMFNDFCMIDQPRITDTNDSDLLDDLPTHVKLQTIERAAHARTVIHGDPSGVVGPDSDPRYNPVLTTRPSRLRTLTRDLAGTRGYSRAQLYRMVSDFESGGIHALIPRHADKSRPDDPRLGLREDTLDTIYRVLLDLARHKSTVGLQARKTRVLRELDHLGINDPLLTSFRLEAVVRILSTEMTLAGTARTRRTNNARAQRGYRRPAPSMPGERIEIDATELNVWIRCPDTGKEIRPWISVAVCVATRLVTVRVTAEKPSGRDTRMLLFDVMSPLVLPEIARPHTLALGVPRETLVHPGMGIGVLVIDHGSEYENYRVVDALARWGSTIELARTRRGMDKPYVESVNRSLAIMQQNLDGFTGDGPENRGDDVNATLTLSAVQSICKEWAMTYYPHLPHSGLPSATKKGHFLTPAQRYEQCLIRGGDLHVAPHPDDVFGFLDCADLAVSSDGVHYRDFRYDGPILNEVRRGAISPLARPGRKRRFFYDSYDRSRMFFRDDFDGRWHTLTAIHDDGTTFPPFSDLVADEFSQFLGRDRLTREERDNAEVAFCKFADELAEHERKRWSLDRARVANSAPVPQSNPGTTETSGIGMPALPPVDVDTFAIWDLEPADTDEVW